MPVPSQQYYRWRVDEHPTAAWTAQQIVDTVPDDTAAAYPLRDRDAIYGD